MTRSAAFRSLGLVALLGCGDRLVEHPRFEAVSPQQRPSKTRVEWQGRTLESSSPAVVAHDTRFADRHFFGVVGGDTETAWRFHMRLTAADLRAGTVRGELAALLDVEDQLDTGRSRVGYAAVASTTAGEELAAEASVGTFEATDGTPHQRFGPRPARTRPRRVSGLRRGARSGRHGGRRSPAGSSRRQLRRGGQASAEVAGPCARFPGVRSSTRLRRGPLTESWSRDEADTEGG